jgi:hypothetical protein
MTKKPTIAELLERIRALEEALKKANAEIARLEARPYIRNFSSNSYM